MNEHRLDVARRGTHATARCTCGGWQLRAPVRTPDQSIEADHALHVQRIQRIEAA